MNTDRDPGNTSTAGTTQPLAWAYAALAASTVLVGSYVGLSKLLVAVFPVLLLAWLRFGVAAVAMLHWVRRMPGEPPLSPRDRRLLFWESSHWATQAAMLRWKTGALTEEDTPPEPPLNMDPLSWRIRAAFIGGASTGEMDAVAEVDAPVQDPGEGTLMLSHSDAMPLVQIRRLYQGSTALGDVWLTAKQEDRASVSRSTCSFECENDGRTIHLHFNRFRNLYEPLLVKGLPVISSPRLGYLRQRTLQHLSALREVGPEAYPYGWMS